jgi:hypothetical protein
MASDIGIARRRGDREIQSMSLGCGSTEKGLILGAVMFEVVLVGHSG